MKKYFCESTGIVKKRYRIVLSIVMAAFLVAGALFLYYHNPIKGLGFACVINYLTGYYCPGCGAGRACFSILHGQLYQAFRYNPLLVILLPWLVLYYFICGMQWLVYGREKLSRRIPEWIPMAVLILMLLYGAVRNIEVYPFTLLAPTRVL